jgi:hypothetical protein
MINGVMPLLNSELRVVQIKMMHKIDSIIPRSKWITRNIVLFNIGGAHYALEIPLSEGHIVLDNMTSRETVDPDSAIEFCSISALNDSLFEL